MSLIVVILILAALAVFIRFLPIRLWMVPVLFASFALDLSYVQNTNFEERSHDVGGHVDYIKYITNYHEIPQAAACWQCYQPPFYYLFASPFYQTFQDYDLDQTKGLQYLSVALSLLFILFSLLTIDLFEFGLMPSIVGGIFIVFLPSTTILSAEIGNDAMLFSLLGAGFYFLIRWIKNLDLSDSSIFLQKYFLASSFIASLALFTKSNAIIFYAVIGITMLQVIRRHFKIANSLKTLLIKAIPALVLLAMGLAFVLKNRGWIAGNVGLLPSQLKVGNHLWNYVGFDLKKYFFEFANPWTDIGGRQYFLNFWLKSALLGEFSYYNPWIEYLQPILGGLFLIWILVFLYSFLFKTILLRPMWVPIVLIVIFSVLAAVMERFMAPYSCTCDFRYVYFIITSIALCISEALSSWRLNGNTIRLKLVLSLAVIWVITGLAFNISFYF